ncbi:Bug family tripartite tricarboxylate transporter substrate binding protein [Roseomonas sp. F4]
MMRRSLLAGAALAGCAATGAQAQPAAYPNRPIRWVVPFGAGGGADVMARLLAEEAAPRLGQPIVIENRPGQAGVVGAAYVAQSAPDGHSILIGTPGVQMTNPFLFSRLPYDPVHGFSLIVQLAQAPNVLVVHPSLPVRDVAGLIAYAKANPDRLSFASTGPGSTSHLGMELFLSQAGLRMEHVPYRSSAQGLIDLVAGRVQVANDGTTLMMPPVLEGQLRVLGISTLRRSEDMPEVPAIAETLPGFESSSLLYLAGPAGLPPAVLARLNAVFNEVLRLPGIRERFRAMGTIPAGVTPEALAVAIEEGRARWRQVIARAGVRLD